MALEPSWYTGQVFFIGTSLFTHVLLFTLQPIVDSTWNRVSKPLRQRKEYLQRSRLNDRKMRQPLRWRLCSCFVLLGWYYKRESQLWQGTTKKEVTADFVDNACGGLVLSGEHWQHCWQFRRGFLIIIKEVQIQTEISPPHMWPMEDQSESVATSKWP